MTDPVHERVKPCPVDGGFFKLLNLAVGDGGIGSLNLNFVGKSAAESRQIG